MAEPQSRTFPITKESMISFGVALAIGSGCYIAGGYAEKLSRLDSIGIERRLVRMEAKLELVAKRLGIPPDVLATVKGEAAEP